MLEERANNLLRGGSRSAGVRDEVDQVEVL